MNATIQTLCLFSTIACGEVVALAHPGEVLPDKKTVVWSPLFQATWDKFNSEFGGEPEKVDQLNKLMAKLDSFKWQAEKIMPKGSWKTWSGPATMDFLNGVNAEASRMTGETEGPFRLLQPNPNHRAAVGVLGREVSFQKAFVRSVSEPLAFRANGKETPVCFFGCRNDLSGVLRDSVRVLAFRPVDQSHAIQILCKEADDSVILYRPAKSMDFVTACSWIRT